MAKFKSGSTIDFTLWMNLDEEEAMALEAITSYGIEAFLKKFYNEMGRHYLKPHEEGLRSLFKTVREEIPKHIRNADAARKLFKESNGRKTK